MMIIIIILLGILALALLWWFFIKVPRPEMTPLTIDENDPLMIEAIKNAKESIQEFIALFKVYPDSSQVKIPFQTSSGQTEFIWAQAKAINNSIVSLFLLTPPITHTGNVDRNQTCDLDNIIDWIVFQENGKAKGGYTMKVMFKVAREKWGQLPDKLIEEEKKYE